MTKRTVPGIPKVGDYITVPHTRIDVSTTSDGRTVEAVRACDCAVLVTAVQGKPTGLTHVWGSCARPGARVVLPIVTRVTPAGMLFNARQGGTPVKRYVLLAEQPTAAQVAA